MVSIRPRCSESPVGQRRQNPGLIDDQSVFGSEKFDDITEEQMLSGCLSPVVDQQPGSIAIRGRILSDLILGKLKIKIGDVHVERENLPAHAQRVKEVDPASARPVAANQNAARATRQCDEGRTGGYSRERTWREPTFACTSMALPSVTRAMKSLTTSSATSASLIVASDAWMPWNSASEKLIENDSRF